MIIRPTPDPAKPCRYTPEEAAQLDAPTEEQINASALADPDNPPLTEAELSRMAPRGRLGWLGRRRA